MVDKKVGGGQYQKMGYEKGTRIRMYIRIYIHMCVRVCVYMCVLLLLV